MTIAIIGAMDEEVIYLKELLDDKEEKTIANVTFYEGKLNGKDIILLQSGIGKVNAAMATTVLMEAYEPAYVINTGSAGGFVQSAEVGDIVIASEVVHHDVDATAFGYAYGQVPQMPARYKSNRGLLQTIERALETLEMRHSIGLIGTGDSFIGNSEQAAEIAKHFPDIHAAEMEAAAIAQVCYQYDIPFVVIRALSDIAGKDSAISFEQFIQIASKNATNMIEQVLKEM